MRLSSLVSLAGVALAAMLSCGCYQLTVRSGLPPAPTPAVKGRFTGGWVNGLVDEEPVLNLGSLCPAGWAEIHYEVGFLTGLVNGIRGLIYTGNDVTVRCAVGPPPQPVLVVERPPPPSQVVVVGPPPPPVVVVPLPPPQAPAAPAAPGAWPRDVPVADRRGCSVACVAGDPPVNVDAARAEAQLGRQLGALRACAISSGGREAPRLVTVRFDPSGKPALEYDTRGDANLAQCVSRIPPPFVSGPPNQSFRCTDYCQ